MDNSGTVAVAGYGPEMHTEPTGRTPHETVQIHSVDVCAGCQAALAWPGTVLTHQPCACVPGGHTAWFCFGCRTWTYDPPHDETTPRLVGGTGYFGGDR